MRYVAIIALAIISALFVYTGMSGPAKAFGAFAVFMFLFGKDDDR